MRSIPSSPCFQAQKLTWLIHLGGPGLILLGLADNSLIPAGLGSMDCLRSCWRHTGPDIWFYYRSMATAGAFWAVRHYHLAQKGGKEALERKFQSRTARERFQKL